MITLPIQRISQGEKYPWRQILSYARLNNKPEIATLSLRTLGVSLIGHLKQLRLAYVRTFRSFDAKAIEEALHKIGIGEGNVVFVHSSYNAFEGYTGNPSDVLTAIETAVGSDGTVMMPSLPFNGSALDYISAGNITDVRRTPSRMGLLTELFRRQIGTFRSLHPTHPVLAKGRLARQLTTGHERATTPCGVNSPFAKLAEVDAKILFLGTSIESMTFFHYLEELYEAKLPISPFTSETIKATVKDGDRMETITMRLYDRTLSRSRCISQILPGLIRHNGLRSVKVGMLEIVVVRAVIVRDVFREMVERGEALYNE